MSTEYPLIKPLMDWELRAGLRILFNNQKPATHFIEVWEGECFKPKCLPISNLSDELRASYEMDLQTIAIFKIRAK